MNDNKLTPWNFAPSSLGPAGNRAITFDYLSEFRMDSPLGGHVRLEPIGVTFERGRDCHRFFGGPVVWSKSGRFAALPEWEQLWWGQRLCVFDFDKETQAVTAVHFSVIEIAEVTESVTTLIDSPRYNPAPSEVAMADLVWVPMRDFPDYVFADGKVLTIDNLARYLGSNLTKPKS